MKVNDLKEFLEDLDDDLEIVVHRHVKYNAYGPAHNFRLGIFDKESEGFTLEKDGNGRVANAVSITF